MANVLNAATAGTSITSDNTDVLEIKTAGTTALTISSSQAATFAKQLALASTSSQIGAKLQGVVETITVSATAATAIFGCVRPLLGNTHRSRMIVNDLSH